MDDSRSNEDASIPRMTPQMTPQMTAPSRTDQERQHTARTDEPARVLEDDDSGFVLGYN